MDNNDFDTQINYAFHGFNPDGTPKPITSEALLFMNTFNRMNKYNRFECVHAWQTDTVIWASIREYEDGGTMVDCVQGCTVASDYEAAARRIVEFCENPPTRIPPAPKAGE